MIGRIYYLFFIVTMTFTYRILPIKGAPYSLEQVNTVGSDQNWHVCSQLSFLFILYFRILFGSNHLFVFHHPRDADLLKDPSKAEEEKPTFESAQKEIADKSGLADLLGLNPDKSKGLFYFIIYDYLHF